MRKIDKFFANTLITLFFSILFALMVIALGFLIKGILTIWGGIL